MNQETLGTPAIERRCRLCKEIKGWLNGEFCVSCAPITSGPVNDEDRLKAYFENE